MNITRGQWLLAVAAAAAAHLCLLGLFLTGGLATRTPDEAPRGVMVSLDALDPGPPPQNLVDSAPVEAAEPEPAAAVAPEPEAAEPSSATDGASAGAPQPTTNIGPQPAEAAPQQLDDVTPAALPEPASSPEAENTTTAPKIADAVTIRPEDVSQPIAPEEQVTARSATPGDVEPVPASESQGNGAFGSSEKSTDDYIVRLRGWLSRHKLYPAAARNNEIEGTVRLYLVINANGDVISQRIVESSGSPMLDEAAKQMLRRSEPLPSMPASMRKNRLELVVPVVFSLR